MHFLMYNPFFWVTFGVLFLTGCASAPKPREVVVEKTTVVYRPAPEALLRDCKIIAPPGKEYTTKSYPEKEAILTNYAGQLLLSLGDCNKDKASLRNLYKKHGDTPD